MFANAWGYLNIFGLRQMVFSGGIWLLWNPDQVEIEVMAYSSQLIHALVRMEGKNEWLLSAIYGSPKAEVRKT